VIDDPPRLGGRFLSTAQFWQLMERWRVPDAVALELLEFAGKVGKSGKRPRFRFSPHQKRLTSWLAEIDSALSAAGADSEWLAKKNRSAPFSGKTPLAFMAANGADGMAAVLWFLTRVALRCAVKG
jgi:hypothetical protein